MLDYLFYLMKVRDYTEDDYAMVNQWWIDNGWPEGLPSNYLPENGMIAYDKKGDIACGWLYKTDSDFCIITWMVAITHRSKKTKYQALEFTMGCLEMLGESLNYKAVFSFYKQQGLVGICKKSGYTFNDGKTTELFKVL